ncbi:MAG: EVE domain-containing protein [Zavarzinella sp.]|nr:EVE domain-containing protein [Zavarzinella sp.]
MALWLCKQEPSCYSYDDLVRDGSTVWDGVSNALARKHLRQMKPGDRVLFYHTGKEKAVVGEMVVAGEPQPDPKAEDEAAVAVEMRPVRKFPAPVTLAQIKADKSLADWDLVRLSRLSVVPVSAAQWKRVEKLGGLSR